jgi:hypothetical protein
MVLIVDDHIDTCRLLLSCSSGGIPAECVEDLAAAVRVAEGCDRA